MVDLTARDVGGTTEFRAFWDSLDEGTLKKEIRDARAILLEDRTRGNKIERRIWPERYRKMKLTNLWRYDLNSGARLLYTILSDQDGFIVSILRVFPNHKEYDEEFGF